MLTLQVIACIGIITGAFLLFQIRLNDFTGNIFHRLLDAPKGIREEILEETKRRKKSYFRREIEEVQEILKTTDREELFPLLCTALKMSTFNAKVFSCFFTFSNMHISKQLYLCILYNYMFLMGVGVGSGS